MDPAEKYLEALPAENPQKKPSRKRTFLVWLFLVMIFFGVFQLFRAPTRPARGCPPDCASRVEREARAPYPPAAVLAGPALALGLALLGWRQLRAAMAQGERNARLDDALFRGAWDEALKEVPQTWQGDPQALTALRRIAEARGDFPALDALSARSVALLEKRKASATFEPYAHGVWLDRVASMVALGRVEEVARTPSAEPALTTERTEVRPRALVLGALVRSARGDTKGFEAHLCAHREELAGSLSTAQRALLAVLRAHAEQGARVTVASEHRAWVLASAPHARACLADEPEPS